MLYARSRLVMACAGAGIVPIDAPFFDLADGAGLIEEIAAAAGAALA